MPKNKKIFEDEFYKMQKIYSDIFKYFFPAKNCTGFVERNLSVAFSKAYELCHSGDICFPWFEFAFGKESKTHIDCCIVNISKKEILLIESKRFNNVNEKIREVHSDIERLISLGNNIGYAIHHIARVGNRMEHRAYVYMDGDRVRSDLWHIRQLHTHDDWSAHLAPNGSKHI